MPGTPDITINPTAVEAAAFGARKEVTRPLPDALKKAQDTVRPLREARAKGEIRGRKGLEEYRKRPEEAPFNQATDGEKLRRRFGAGLVEFDDTKTPSVIKEPSDTKAAESFRAADKMLKPINAVLKYADVWRIKDEKGISFEDACAFAGIKLSERDAVRNAAVNAIIALPNMRELFPGLTADEAGRDFVDNALASNPQFRQALAGKMRAILDDEPPTVVKPAESAEVVAAKAEKDRLGKRVHDAVRDVKATVDMICNMTPGRVLEGTRLADGAEKLLKSGVPLEDVLRQTRAIMVARDSEVTAVEQHLLRESQIRTLQTKSNDPKTIDSEKRSLETKIKEVQGEQARLKDSIGEPAFSNASQRYLLINAVTSTGVDAKGEYTSGIAFNLNVVVQAYRETGNLERTIAEETAKAETAMALAIAPRLEKESEQLQSLDAALNDTVIDTLQTNMDEMDTTNKDMLVQKERELEESVKPMGAKIKEAMSERWSKRNFDTGRTTYNEATIGADLRKILYRGPEEGIRQLIFERAQEKGDFEGKTGLGDLNPDQQAQLQKLVDTYGPAYLNGIRNNFVSARTDMGQVKRIQRSVFGTHGEYGRHLSLQPFEQKLLQKAFVADTLKMAVQSKDDKKIDVELAKAGVDVKDQKKKKSFLILLAMLGIGTLGMSVKSAEETLGAAA